MKPTLNVGLIGLGFIGKVHALAYRAAPLCLQNPVVHPCLHAVLRRHIAPADTLWRDAGFTLATDDPDHFYAQPLDIVDLCTPNFRHREEARQAMQAGMAVYCEKPLAHTLEDARAMAALAAETGALTKVAFVLRYLPAIRQMKALLSAGALGEVLHFRAHMFHESYLNPQRPMSWRLRKAQAGGGAFMDLGAHLVDLVRYLLGDIAAVRGHTRTFIPRRPVKGADLATVDVDDWTLATLTLKNGAVGTLETSRMAAGSRESTACEIYGRRGALIFHAQDPHAVRYHDLETGRWCEGHIDLPAPPGERPLAQLRPPDKLSQGFMTDMHMASVYDFVLDVAEGKPSPVDFQAGLAVQEVITAIYRSAAAGGQRIDLPLNR